MKTVDLNNKRDFPLTTNALKFIQEAYADFEQLVKIGGDNYILSGCVITGSSVSTGWVVIGGKLMPFSGGVIQPNVKVVTTVNNITVGRGVRDQTSYNAEFGTSTNPAENIIWSSLSAKRIVPIIDQYPQLAQLTTDLATTKRIVIAMGAWNMMSLSEKTYNLPSSFDISKVTSMSAVVYSDDGSARNFVYTRQNDGVISGQFMLLAGTPPTVYLSRDSAGPYNTASFNDSTINRGYIEITYIP